MEFQERLMKLAQYNVGCRFVDGCLLINLVYRPEWVVIQPESSAIEYMQKENVHYYCAPMEERAIEELFLLIDETIEYNLELEEKVRLFNDKVVELKELFCNETLDNLKKVEFVIKKNEKKPKKKKSAKKEEKPLVQDKEEGIKIAGTEESVVCKEFVEEKSVPMESELDDGIVFNEYTGEDDDNIVQPMEEIER